MRDETDQDLDLEVRVLEERRDEEMGKRETSFEDGEDDLEEDEDGVEAGASAVLECFLVLVEVSTGASFSIFGVAVGVADDAAALFLAAHVALLARLLL